MGKIIRANKEEIKRYAPRKIIIPSGSWSEPWDEIERQDMLVLPADKESDKRLGWTITETVGMGIVNPRAVTRMGIDFGEEPKELTEEEKETRRIEDKGW